MVDFLSDCGQFTVLARGLNDDLAMNLIKTLIETETLMYQDLFHYNLGSPDELLSIGVICNQARSDAMLSILSQQHAANFDAVNALHWFTEAISETSTVTDD